MRPSVVHHVTSNLSVPIRYTISKNRQYPQTASLFITTLPPRHCSHVVSEPRTLFPGSMPFPHHYTLHLNLRPCISSDQSNSGGRANVCEMPLVFVAPRSLCRLPALHLPATNFFRGQASNIDVVSNPEIRSPQNLRTSSICSRTRATTLRSVYPQTWLWTSPKRFVRTPSLKPLPRLVQSWLI